VIALRVPPAAWRAAFALLLLVTPAAAWGQETMLDPEVFEIGRLIRCPTCVSESVAESSATVAQEMRQIIQEQLDEGRSRAEIIASFQASYGDWILLEPPARGLFLIVWAAPIVAFLAAAAGLVVLVRRWRTAAEVPPADAADLARVRAALAHDDAADAAAPTTPTPRH
jgi:cytochrome c-type biogenesis protein CcmH